MANGYRTEQKQLIDEILSTDKDFSCDEIVDYLRSKGTPVSVPTVYRRLAKLKEAGKVNSFYVDGKLRYRRTKTDTGFAILKCNSCGKSFKLDCDDLHDFSDHLMSHHNFLVDTNSIILYGLCKECMK